MSMPTDAGPQQPIRYDFDTLRAGAQCLGQFGQALKQMGLQFKQIHQQLAEHCSGDESGIGGAIADATSDSAEAAGDVFAEGGRVLGAMGSRVQNTSDSSEDTDRAVAQALNEINGEEPSTRQPTRVSEPTALDSDSRSNPELNAAGQPNEIPVVPDEPGTVHLAGSGGPWSTVDEQPGGTVAQSTPMSCVSASGERLSGGVLKQDDLISQIGDPASLEQLRDRFNEASVDGSTDWKAGSLPSDDLYRALINTGKPYIAEMKLPGVKIAHAVVVTGGDDSHVNIADPADGGSTYKMTWNEFLQYRSGRVMFHG